MLALDRRVVDAAWEAVRPLIPEHVPPTHPFGGHRQRVGDRECFTGILYRLVLGCSWFVASQLCDAGETTLRRRRDEWITAGVFERLVETAMETYDTEIGLEVDDVSVDGSCHKAPFGGEGTGKSPVDRGKRGWKWSIATESNGIPLGWAVDGANRQDSKLLLPTLLDVIDRGHFCHLETLHLDRGYNGAPVRDICSELTVPETVVAPKRERGSNTGRTSIPLGERWPVERTNSWLSNFGQLRRNTDRFVDHRLAQFALAVSMLIFVKLFKAGV